MAVLAFQIVGTVIGTMIGGPIGGAIGGAIGATVGNLLFPPKFSAPPLPELHVQTSSNGSFIPIGYGSVRFPAIIVDAPEKFTRNEQTSGGKGGPEVTTRSYSIDWLDCMFCESKGTHSLGRVWHTGRLVGNYLEGAAQTGELPLVSYNGAASQLPDPTEESHYGVGMLSARRGVARHVYTGLPLGENANTLPIVNAEMVSNTAPVEGPIIAVMEVDDEPYAWPAHPDANYTSNDYPPHPAIRSFPRNGDPIRVRVRNDDVVQTYSSTTLAYIGSEAAGVDDFFPADWTDSLYTSRPLGTYVYNDDSTTPLWQLPERIIAAGVDRPVISSTQYVSVGGSVHGTNWAVAAGLPLGEYLTGSTITQDGRIVLAMTSPTASSASDKWYRIVNGVVASSGTISPATSFLADGPSTGSNGGGRPHAMSLENNGRWLWVLLGNTGQAQVWYISDANNLAFNVLGGTFTALGGGGLVAASIQTLATAGFAGVIFRNSLALLTRFVPGQYYGIPLSEIVADQHARCGDDPSAYDVTELTDIVRGLGIFAAPTGRSVIEALEDIYAFKPVDSDTGVKYVKLGKPSIVTIPDADLCAHDENGSDIPSPLQVVLGNDLELPCQIWIKYMDWNADYQTGAQQWHRQNTLSKIVRTIETAVVLTAHEAKQIVEAIGQRTLVEADKYTWYTTRGGTALDADGDPLPYIKLEGTDVVTVKGIDLRIETKLEQMATGIIKWTGVRSHPGVVVQTGAGSGESEGFTPQEIVEPQETELAILDIPLLGADHRQGVIHVEMQGALRRAWRGAALMKSLDGGTNYTQQAIDVTPGTIGVTLNALPNYGGASIDEASELDVLIHPGGGELASATRDAVFAGANRAMVGAEMIAYKNAVLTDVNEYRLTGLLRGLNGTEWAMRGHAMTDSPAVGETFVVLPAGVTLNATSADYGYTRKYKAVTLGRTLATADAVDFRSNGVPLAPYSPVNLRAGFNGAAGSSDLLLGWVRRSRLNPGWVNFRAPTGTGPPLGEEIEAYRVQIYEDGTYQTVVRTVTIVAGTDFDAGDPEFVYTTAMQTTDFGSALAVRPAWSVAQIGALGPGYSAYFNGAYGGLPLFVPSTIPGYVPPVPPPAGGILSVMDWNTPVRIFSGPFGPNDVWSIQFTTGNVPSPSNNFVVLAAAEYQGPYVTRQWTLSPIRGDFGPQLKPGASGEGNAVAVFAVGTDDYPFYPTVPFLSTWYLNIRNTPSVYSDMQMDCEIANVP